MTELWNNTDSEYDVEEYDEVLDEWFTFYGGYFRKQDAVDALASIREDVLTSSRQYRITELRSVYSRHVVEQYTDGCYEG